MKKGLLLTIFTVFLAGHTASAQEGVPAGNSGLSVSRLMFKADSLRKEYLFAESSALYSQALEKETDSLKRDGIEAAKVLADNGAMMLGFVSEPIVVARHRFSADDFFLFYPLEDRSWKNIPNKLDHGYGKSPVKAIYFPDGCEQVVYSAAESAEDCRNIYRSEHLDTSWSAPVMINESLTSTGNEIYPMLSPDGKTLYFASSGLYGVGGYDLYSSSWNESTGDWDAPVNLGFPYSSPADDYLYINTDDGKYTIFASNRFCDKDSVDVFVLEFDNMPIRKEVTDIETIRKITALEPVEDPYRMDNGDQQVDIQDNEETRSYVEKMSQVRTLKDSIALYEKSLEKQRREYATVDDNARKEAISAEILRQETLLPQFQDQLEKAVKELQKIEMDFLFKGVVIDPEKVMAKADREVVGSATAYTFTKMNMGRMPVIQVEEPKVDFDYSFKILPVGQFAKDNRIPEGIIYQIQMFSLGAPATEKQIRGLSPVFETRSDNGRYIYRVGVFSQYNDALSNLNKVRRQGCKDAFIVAFRDGKKIDLKQARQLEKTLVKAMWQVIINPGDDELPQSISKVIRDFCEKDVIKTQSNGITMFVVAPFTSQIEAEELEALIRDNGIPTVSVSEIQQ